MMPFALAAIALALLAAAILLRRRHRQTWSAIFELRARCDDLESALMLSRKETALLAAGTGGRLPLQMPSQNGEDLLLWNFFERKHEGFFVEVGAYDGVSFSNSYFFEAIGWSGILVEAVPELHAQCLAARPHSRVVHAAAGSHQGETTITIVSGAKGIDALSSVRPDRRRIEREGGATHSVSVPLLTLDSILSRVNEQIDFVSIDVEGAELEVLRGFDLSRFKPRVLLIEENDPRDVSVRDHLSQHGYVRRFRVEQNHFYTRTQDERSFGWTI